LLDGLRTDERPIDEQLDEEARDAALRVELDRALEALDKRERFIVERRLLAEDETSLADLGRALGVSRERARQLEARAKTKLQKSLRR
jgi:RNA polymerase sigma-32 factor